MNIYEQQTANRRMTALIMAVFVLFFLLIGLGFDYFYLNYNPLRQPEVQLSSDGYYEVKPPSLPHRVPFGTIIALLIGAGLAANSYFNGPGMVLRSTMSRLAVLDDDKERQFINVVSEMAAAAGLPPPKAYVIPDPDLNAFATGTGPGNAVIAVTEGTLQAMTREELEGVVGHEMSHIRNYDTRLMTICAALMGAIALLSDFAGRSMRFGGRGSSRGSSDRRGGGVLMIVLFAVWIVLVILAPLISRMLAMAISRRREYLADAGSAELTRNPQALISALEKIRAAVMPTRAINNGVAHMCITDPRGSLIEEKTGLTADLLATHPPMEKRILALKIMAYQTEHPQPQAA